MRSLRNPLVHDLLIGAGALLITMWIVAVGGGGFPLDDSWIHQTYARNLAVTGVWSYVDGVPSVASTAPLYTVLLSFAYSLGIPYSLWTHALGALILAAIGWVARRLALRAAPDRLWFGLATGLVCVFSWHLVWAAASGMDTALAALWTAILLLLAWRETDASWPRPWARALVFGAAAGLAMLTRPESVLLTGLCGIVLLIAHTQRRVREMFVWLVIAGCAWLVVVAPYFLLNLEVAGSLLPSTNAAKQAGLAPRQVIPVIERFANLLIALLVGAQLLLVVGVVWYTVRWFRRLRKDRTALLFLLAPAWAIALPLLYAIWLPFWEQHGRYVIPALPGLLVAGVVGTGWMLEWARDRALTRVTARVLALAAAAVLVAFAFLMGPLAYQRDVTIINTEMVDPAHWIAANIPGEENLATHDIGAIGFFAPRPLLDVAGLISPEVVPVVNNKDGLWALFEARDIVYLMALDDQVPGDDVNDPRLCPIYRSNGTTILDAGGTKMTVYRLAYDGNCPPETITLP